MSDNAQFLANPLMFMRQWAVSPPDGSPVGKLLKEWTVDGSNFSGADVTIQSLEAGTRIQFMDFAKNSLFPGALTLRLSDIRKNANQIPIHWLPWGSNKVFSTTIPEVPRNMVEEEEDVNPRFFFTAGISGCSVFVKGPATHPTIYHAGTQEKLTRDAGAFWLEQLDTGTRGRAFDYSIFSNVDKSQYMGKDTAAVREYLDWAQGKAGHRDSFTVKLVNCFGCIFGIRFGHYWSFYLQEAGLVQTVQFLKESQTKNVAVQKKYTTEYHREEEGTGALVDVERQVMVQRKLGPIPLPFKKLTTIYSKALSQRCTPFRVSEIFPKRQWSGDVKSLLVERV